MSAPVNVRAVLFDLYRTLLDIWTDEKDPRVWHALSRFLSYQGIWLEPADFSARYFAGAAQQLERMSERYPEVDVTSVFQEIIAEREPARAVALAPGAAAAFRVFSTVRIQLFPDVLPTLQRLHGRFRLGVVSDAQRAYFRTELDATGLTPLLDTAVASGEYGFHKPDPRLFHIALERLGVPPDQAVYVGDSPDRDICGAQTAGLFPVLLDRFGDRGLGVAGCRPGRIVRDLGELHAWLGSAAARES